MAHKMLIAAFSIFAAAAPISAAQPDPMPTILAPAGTPETKYCLRVEPVTGSLVESIQCWTRAEWAEQDVDVDREWAREGVAVKG